MSWRPDNLRHKQGAGDRCVIDRSNAGGGSASHQRWNRAAERIYGYTAREAVGQSILMIVPPERRGEITGLLNHVRVSLGLEHRIDYWLLNSPRWSFRFRMTAAPGCACSQDIKAEARLPEITGGHNATCSGVPEIVQGSNHLRYLHLGGHVRLTTDIPLSYIPDSRPFVVNGPMYLVFSYGPPLEAPLAATVEEFLDKTRKCWIQWVKTTSIASIFQEAIVRSALVLKLHQFEDTGAIIAAGTTSLPEFPQSGRTWDYRFCWLRDTYYTLNAFNRVGHFEELERYFEYVQNLMSDQRPVVQPVYTITGDAVPPEQELPLDGYQGNRPVRIGNNAAVQPQHDVYGQVLISLLPLYVDKRLRYHDRRSTLGLIRGLLDRIERVFEEPDAGVWEYRNRLQHHCYTCLFHWAGSLAALKIANSLGDEVIKAKATSLVKRSAERIEACYDPDRQVYTQAVGAKHLDASVLQLVSLNYLDLAGGQWGNFPQTYSHVGLMNAIYRIARKLDQPMFF